MATLTIRNLPDDVRDKLRVLAAENGRSMEAEVRSIISGSIRESQAARGSESFEATARRVQDMFRDLTTVQPLASDELIAERRLEAAREEVEANEWLRQNGDQTFQRFRDARS